jgi:hypothetical protein
MVAVGVSIVLVLAASAVADQFTAMVWNVSGNQVTVRTKKGNVTIKAMPTTRVVAKGKTASYAKVGGMLSHPMIVEITHQHGVASKIEVKSIGKKPAGKKK